MKTALVTTTIHVPRVLDLFRKYDPDVRFFIAGDLKTPHQEMMDWIEHVPNAVYYSPDAQKHLNYKCSDILGWNCIQRRNIMVLEALKWGADMIVTWDDDNIPMNAAYFYDFESVLDSEFNGVQLKSPHGWINPYGGAFPHRGFPYNYPRQDEVSTIINAKVGVVAGLCLGDPDIDAYTRMAIRPHNIIPNEVHRAGVIVGAGNWTVFNTQNTSYLRQFAPAMFCAPDVGRHDDIFASILTQRVMRDRGYHVHIGQPFVFQQRNDHDLLQDLKQEIFGMEHMLAITDFIDRMPEISTYGGATVLSQVANYYKTCPILPPRAQEAGLAWCEDVDTVMK